MLYITIYLLPLTVSLAFTRGFLLSDQGKPIACDINARNESCPDDFCCVRDEFLFSETYCRQYGKAGKPCGTKPSQFECPCEPGYQCATNIHGHVTSLFGKCFPIPGLTTDSTVDSVTSDMPDNDMTTADYSVDYGGTTDGYYEQDTTEGVTTGHTKYSDEEPIVG